MSESPENYLSPPQLKNLDTIRAHCGIDIYGWMFPVSTEMGAYANWSQRISDCEFIFTGRDRDALEKMSPIERVSIVTEAGMSAQWVSSTHWKCIIKFGEFKDEFGRWIILEAHIPDPMRISKRPKTKTSCAFFQLVLLSMTLVYLAAKVEGFPEFLPTDSHQN